LRGGGGSTWGIITSLTVRAHVTPEGGIAEAKMRWAGTNCSVGSNWEWDGFDDVVAQYTQWALTLDKKWSGLGWFTPSLADDASSCGAKWEVFLSYIYLGPETDEEFQNGIDSLLSSIQTPPTIKNITTYPNWGLRMQGQPLQHILPVPWLTPLIKGSMGGLPSVFVSRDKTASGELAEVIQSRAKSCLETNYCPRQELYNCLTGNLGSPQEKDVSISEGFRSSLFHYIIGNAAQNIQHVYNTLGDHSYFSESAFIMFGVPHRYWGENYERLAEVKKTVDPNRRFWCRNCVGNYYEE
jgi:Berberine and berberine like